MLIWATFTEARNPIGGRRDPFVFFTGYFMTMDEFWRRFPVEIADVGGRGFRIENRRKKRVNDKFIWGRDFWDQFQPKIDVKIWSNFEQLHSQFKIDVENQSISWNLINSCWATNEFRRRFMVENYMCEKATLINSKSTSKTGRLTTKNFLTGFRPEIDVHSKSTSKSGRSHFLTVDLDCQDVHVCLLKYSTQYSLFQHLWDRFAGQNNSFVFNECWKNYFSFNFALPVSAPSINEFTAFPWYFTPSSNLLDPHKSANRSDTQ